MFDVGKKYVPTGVFLTCDKGDSIGTLSVTRTSPKVNGEVWANEFDATPNINIPTLGTCNITKGPCSPVTTIWSKPISVNTSIGLGKPIIEDSFCKCALGGKIKIFFSIQDASNELATEEAKRQAEEYKKLSMWFLGAAIVVGLSETFATGGLIGSAAGSFISTAVTMNDANKGALLGGAIGAAVPYMAASGTATLLAEGSLAFPGFSVVSNERASYYQPNIENGPVLVADPMNILWPKLMEGGFGDPQGLLVNTESFSDILKKNPDITIGISDILKAIRGGINFDEESPNPSGDSEKDPADGENGETDDSPTGENGETDDSPTKEEDVPEKAKDIANQIKNNNGNPPEGYQGGRPFENDGRNNGEVLPRVDSNGNPITYTEYDVNPYQQGVNRGEERIVIDSNGNTYYTSDHYGSFTKF
jgi:guanyl-specific ribonuclease Sa